MTNCDGEEEEEGGTIKQKTNDTRRERERERERVKEAEEPEEEA